MKNNIQVSIICNTYNHEKYIRDALNGFLEQKTDFPIEILIHDDASTDGTASIINEYETKYPEIVKPIYQKINQYSQNIDIIEKFQCPRINGKYVAFCEGDDYWKDSLKLQKQFDIMEENQSVDICAHAVLVENVNGNYKLEKIKPSNKDTLFSIEEVIAGGGGFVATNSLFMRSQLFQNLPRFYKYYSIDYALQIYGSMRGGMLYMADEMAVYRYMTNNSWTYITSKNEKYRNKKEQKLINMLNLVDSETNGKYNKIISEVIRKMQFEKLVHSGHYRMARTNMRDIFNKCPLTDKMFIYAMDYCPSIVKFIKKICITISNLFIDD